MYLTTWVSQFEDWRRKNPSPLANEVAAHVENYSGKQGSRLYPLHLPLDTGQRSTSLCRVYAQVRRSPLVPDAVLVEVVKLLAEHARLLTQMPIEGNHLAIATGGLAAVGVLFPEFRESAQWREEARLRLEREVERQVYPDGAQNELAPWYHYTALRQFSNIAELLATNGHAIGPKALTGIERMYEHLMRIADPEGLAPPLSDSEYLNVSGVLGRALDFFPGRSDFRFIASRGAGGLPPEGPSLLSPWAGLAALRSGWGAEDLYLLFDYGPFGTGHMHEDKLGLVVNAYGRRILVDAGRSHYEVSLWRDYMVNATAHSTVLVNGLGQVRRLDPSQRKPVTTLPPVIWEPGVDVDYVAGTFGVLEGEAFALPVNPPGEISPFMKQLVADDRWREATEQPVLRAIHRRHVLFVKSGYWVIVDEIEPYAPGVVAYQSLFLFGEGQARAEGLSVQFGAPGEAGAVLSAMDGAGARLAIEVGSREPNLMGWRFDRQKPVPTPCAVFRRQGGGRSVHVYALVPHRKGEGFARPVFREERGTVRVSAWTGHADIEFILSEGRLIWSLAKP